MVITHYGAKVIIYYTKYFLQGLLVFIIISKIICKVVFLVIFHLDKRNENLYSK